MKLLSLLFALTLAGCGAQLDVAISDEEDCRAEAVGWAVGQKFGAELAGRIMDEAGTSHMRVLKPNQPTTMDHRGDRVSVDVDEQDVIVGVRCG